MMVQELLGRGVVVFGAGLELLQVRVILRSIVVDHLYSENLDAMLIELRMVIRLSYGALNLIVESFHDALLILG